MLTVKRVVSLMLSISMLITSVNIVLAKDVSVIDDKLTASEKIEEIKEHNKNSDNENVTILEEVNYNQEIIDKINNNPIEISVSEEISSLDTISEEITVTETVSDETLASATVLSTVSSLPEEFKVEPVSAPFNVYNNDNESVSLATGALNFEKTLLSLPGRNDFNLNIGIRYNSEDSVITENEYDDEATIRTTNFNQFAIGWSFEFTTIIKSLSINII